MDKIEPTKTAIGFDYRYVKVETFPDRSVTITLEAPVTKEPTDLSAMLKKGADLWLIRAFRELDDALLRLRFFYRDHGLWLFKTRGDQQLLQDAEKPLYTALAQQAPWLLREILLLIGRVFKRLEVSSRSLVALLDEDSCYAGLFAELLFIVDRSYALITPKSTPIRLSSLNLVLRNWANEVRLNHRFAYSTQLLQEILQKCDGQRIHLGEAHRLGLITFALDEIDFDDELRVFKEERIALSPDALSAMEANLRFPGSETMATKIFGRLSAWQNWVFIRENATGLRGALTSYGEEKRAAFDLERC